MRAVAIETIMKIMTKPMVIEAPGGVSNWYEALRPPNIPIILIMIPNRIVCVKLLEILIAVAEGITIKADTNRAPTIGIMILMVAPVTIENAIVIKRTGKPAVLADASSKLMT